MIDALPRGARERACEPQLLRIAFAAPNQACTVLTAHYARSAERSTLDARVTARQQYHVLYQLLGQQV